MKVSKEKFKMHSEPFESVVVDREDLSIVPQGVGASLLQLNLNASRKDVLDYFNNGWALTELLFSGLASEAAFYCRPYHQLRHPMIFYYAHPAVLYVNKLRLACLIYL